MNQLFIQSQNACSFGGYVVDRAWLKLTSSEILIIKDFAQQIKVNHAATVITILLIKVPNS